MRFSPLLAGLGQRALIAAVLSAIVWLLFLWAVA